MSFSISVARQIHWVKVGAQIAIEVGGPVVHNVLKKNEVKNFHFVHVGVGTYTEWKDPYSPFKTNQKLQLEKLPTILFWRHPDRLTGKECIDEEKVKELFEGLP